MVWDANSQPPALTNAGDYAESGRGLFLVEAFSERWDRTQRHRWRQGRLGAVRHEHQPVNQSRRKEVRCLTISPLFPRGPEKGESTMFENIDDVVDLTCGEIDELWQRLAQFGRSRDLTDIPDDEAVELSWTLVKAMPLAVIQSIRGLLHGETAHDALLFRNVVPSTPELEPTPSSLYHSPRHAKTRLRELVLLGVMSLLGEPFTFASLYGGRIVQDVVPVRGAEDEQTSGGSKAFLEWHVEDAFSADRCDYFGLMCLRGEETAATRIAAAKNLLLGERHRAVLREDRFVIVPDIGHTLEGAGQGTLTPVLSGPESDPEICFDSVYMRPSDDRDSVGREALECVASAIMRAGAGHTLKPGDLLIVDNRRVMHARTPFNPRFDGSDRWLMRAMVCSSPLQHRRRGGARAIA
jgi:L-asparagine oxygenase